MTNVGAARNEHTTDRGLTRVEHVVLVAAVVLIGLLAAQPLLVTRDPFRQSEFAWEMYSKGAPRDEFVVLSDDSSERLIVTDIQPRGLALVDYTEVLPAFICANRAGAVEVQVYRADTLIGTHECER
jgi:hypothetical protein